MNTVTGHLFNLVIYTQEKRRYEYFRQLVHDLVEKFPSRVIFIDGNNLAHEDRLKTTALPVAGKSPCDQLAISAPLSQLEQVPFLILPHLIPDLPIFLVWGQNPTTENTILPSLEKIATRLVFDAECVEDLQDFSKKMLRKVEAMTIDVMDVTWAAISSWRDAMAHTFNTPELIHQMKNCRRICVKYNKHASSLCHHHATQAIYFQGWIGVQLGWHNRSISYAGDVITLNYDNGTGTTEVVLEPQERPPLADGTIFEVELTTEEALHVTLSLAEKQAKILVYFSTPQKCDIPFSLPYRDSQRGASAMRELFYYRASDHYRHMLQALSQVAWKKF